MTPIALLLAASALTAPVPKAAPRAGLIGVVKDGEVLLLRPDGEVADRLKAKKPWREDAIAHPAPTASGFPVAVMAVTGTVEGAKGKPMYQSCGVWLIAGSDDPDGKLVDAGENRLRMQLVWSRDGKRVYVHCFLPADDLIATVAKHGTCGVGKYLAIDPATGKLTDIPIPEAHQLIGETADGKLLTDGWWPEAAKKAPNGPLQMSDRPLFRVSADGKTVEELEHKLPSRLHALDLSPDGRTLLCRGYARGVVSDTAETFDIVSGEKAVIELADLKGKFIRAANSGSWSPDGKRFVFAFGEEDGKGRVLSGWKLMACDADGRNCKELLSSDGASALKASWK
jgi:hypothetical protein